MTSPVLLAITDPTLRWSPTRTTWPSAIRRGLLVVLPLLAALLLDQPAIGMLIATGSFNIGFVDAPTSHRELGTALVLTSIGTGVSITLAIALGSYLIPMLIVAAVIAFVAGTLAASGIIYQQASFTAIVIFSIFTAYPDTLSQALFSGLFVLAGALLQASATMLSWLIDDDGAQRRVLGLMLRDLADLAEKGEDPKRRSPQVAVAFSDAETMLERSYLPPARQQAYDELFAHADLLRLSLATLERRRPSDSLVAFREAIAAELRACDQLLRTTRGNRRILRVQAVVATHQVTLTRARELLTARPHSRRTLRRRVDDICHELTAVAQSTLAHIPSHTISPFKAALNPSYVPMDLTQTQELPRLHPDPERAEPLLDITEREPLLGQRTFFSAYNQIKAAFRPGSPMFQHGIRLALAVVLAEFLTVVVLGPNSMWVTLTVVMLVRPDFGQAITRGIGRFIGTFLGLGLTTILVSATNGNPVILLIVVAIGAPLMYALITVNYLGFSAALTATLAAMIGVRGGIADNLLQDRLLDTLIGAAIALVVYLLIPEWRSGAVNQRLGSLAKVQRLWTAQVLQGLMNPDSVSKTELRNLGHQMREARLSAQRAAESAALEPTMRGPRADAAQVVVRQLHASVVGALALEAMIRPGNAPIAGLEDIANRVDVDFELIERASAQQPIARLRMHRSQVEHHPQWSIGLSEAVDSLVAGADRAARAASRLRRA